MAADNNQSLKVIGVSFWPRFRTSRARYRRKRYAKPPLTPADFLSPFTPPRQSAAPALQPKLRASVHQSSK